MRRRAHCPQSLRLHPLAFLISALCAASAYAADEATPRTAEASLDAVTVRGASDYQPSTQESGLYTTRKSRSATGLNLSLRETPQTVSVVTRSQMDDFKLNSVNDALAATSGIIVEKVETDRTYYTARGFDVTNFMVDGVGMPMTHGQVDGDLDTAIYDRIDAVYGANGLATGTGYPSASINFVRKRPTRDFAASAGLKVGSWNRTRLDGDISAPLNADGSVRARLVVARDTGKSYVDRYSHDKTVFYGVIEADLSDSTRLALGHTQQENKAQGAMWGALPLAYSNGTPTSYPVSTSTAANWSYWNTTVRSSFAELTQELGGGWTGKAVYTHTERPNEGALFYAYGQPNASTGLGLYSYPSLYAMKNKQDVLDLSASGQYTLAGRQHELNLGLGQARADISEVSNYGVGIGTALPALENWTGEYPIPSFTASVDGSTFKEDRRSAYAATRLNASDRLKLIGGLRHTSSEVAGKAYGVSRAVNASRTTPYAGAVYDLTPTLSAYGSYAEIFNPQHHVDAGGAALKPVEGNSVEVGLKSEFFDRKGNASVALFRSEQRNLAEAAGTIGATTYYRGIDAISEGLQADVSGQLSPRLQAGLGYTQLILKDPQGREARTYVPRQLLRLTSTYRVPGMEQLKVGGNLSWQRDTYARYNGAEIRQQAYALLNLMARYDFSRKLNATVNLNNVSDQKYVGSLMWASSNGQGTYGAPRNASVALNWTY